MKYLLLTMVVMAIIVAAVMLLVSQDNGCTRVGLTDLVVCSDGWYMVGPRA